MLIKYQNWHCIPIDAHQTFNDLLVKVKACVTVLSGLWVNTVLTKVHSSAVPQAWTIQSTRSTDSKVEELLKNNNNEQTGDLHAICLSRSFNSILKANYKSRK